MHAESAVTETLILLLGIAILVGVLARYIKVPYTVALVVVGVALHAFGLVPEIRLTQELLMMGLLPALLFEAAIHIPGGELKRFAPSIAIFAIPGVLLASFVTAALVSLEVVAFEVGGDFPFLELLLFGSIIAATDPISVVALFKQLGVEKRLAILIEGESLFNDGTAVVVVGVLVQAVVTGSFSVPGSIVKFVLVAVGGILIGAAFGLLASFITNFFEDHLIEIGLTVVTAYGSFLLAEQVHASGVLATVIAGLFVGNVAKKRGMSPRTRQAVLAFWEFAAFFINSLVFLLIGLEVDLGYLISRFDVVLLAFFAVLAARALTIFLPLPFLKRMGQPVNTKVGIVMWWGGLRGGLSMVLVLALPESVTSRADLITMVFGVVLLSVVLQGSTMGWLLKRLGLIKGRTEAASTLGKGLARLTALRAQRKALDKEEPAGIDLPGVTELRERLVRDEEALVAELRAQRGDEAFIEASRNYAEDLSEYLEEVRLDELRVAQAHGTIKGVEFDELIDPPVDSPAKD